MNKMETTKYKIDTYRVLEVSQDKTSAVCFVISIRPHPSNEKVPCVHREVAFSVTWNEDKAEEIVRTSMKRVNSDLDAAPEPTVETYREMFIKGASHE